MRMESPLNQRLRRSPPDVVYTPIDVTSRDVTIGVPSEVFNVIHEDPDGVPVSVLLCLGGQLSLLDHPVRSCSGTAAFPSPCTPTATFYNWLKKGEAAKSGVFCEFFDAVSRAKADSALRLVSQITLQAPTDWRAAAFLLERRFPDDYGKRTEVTGKDGGPVKVDAKTQHVFQPTKELWDEIVRKRAEFEALRDGDADDGTADDP